MTLIPDDISRKTFDAIAGLGQPDSLEALQAAVTPHFDAMGVDVVTAGVQHRHRSGHTLLFGDFDHRWTQHYLEHGWNDRAPIAAIAASSPAPVFWSDIKPNAEFADVGQLFAEAKAFGIQDGHALIIDRGMGTSMIIGTASRRRLVDPDLRVATYLLSLHYALIGFDLWRRGQPSRTDPEATVRTPDLTERQIECLKWTRDGKTAWEIGAILGLSSRTVEEHLHKATVRLGVGTRMQAVVEAARRGLIAL